MTVTKILSLIALATILLPCLLYCVGVMQLTSTQTAVLLGTVVWFCATPLWMGRTST